MDSCAVRDVSVSHKGENSAERSGPHVDQASGLAIPVAATMDRTGDPASNRPPQ